MNVTNTGKESNDKIWDWETGLDEEKVSGIENNKNHKRDVEML